MSRYPSFCHAPLPARPDAIRLIEVLPDLQDDLIQCRIMDGRTSDTYTALSYTWGPVSQSQDILLDGHVFVVRRNLWDFLHIARQNYPGIAFWIDAVCINQDDIQERNQQVSLMSTIYGSAARTFVWLGSFEDPDYGTQATLSIKLASSKRIQRSFDHELRQCLQLFEQRSPAKNNWSMTGKVAVPPDFREFGAVSFIIEKICQHPYWTRLWVVQEVILSSQKVILLDGLSMQWSSLVEVLHYVIGENAVQRVPRRFILMAKTPAFKAAVRLERQRYRQQLSLHTDPSMRRPWLFTQYSSFLLNRLFPSRSAHVELGRLRDRFRGSPSHELMCKEIEAPRTTTERQGLLHLFRRFRSAHCHDLRDKIYGLTSLSDAARAFPVDYSLDVYDLYFRACQFFLTEHDPDAPPYHWTWVTSATALMKQLELGLLDLICGDKKRRSRIMLVTTPEHPPYTTTSPQQLVQAKVNLGGDLLQKYSISGTCVVCAKDLDFRTTIPSLAAYCILQCHQLDRQDDPHILTAGSTAEHLIVYRCLGLPGSHASRAMNNHSLTPAAAAHPSNVNPLQSHLSIPLPALIDVLHLQNSYPAPRQLFTRSKPHFLRPKSKKIKLPFMLDILEPLLEPSTRIHVSDTSYTREMLDALEMEDSAKEILVTLLQREGFLLEVTR